QDRRVMAWDEKREFQEEIRNLREDNCQLRAQIFQQVWSESDVVVATHTVCGDPILKGRTFDWVIMDEATQAIEPSSWIPLLRAGRVVLAGDHCQLPPTVFSRKTGPESLRLTLFERFHRILGDESKIRLELQYRMNEKIMNFSSQKFYDGRLTACVAVRDHLLKDLPHVQAEDLSESPIVFLDTAGLGYEEKIEVGTKSRYNEEEAKLVVKLFEKLVQLGVRPEGIALISPYSAQVKLLTNLILGEDLDSSWERIPDIDSIDAFQGQEREAVIVSLVRSNLKGELGFLNDTRRMNVAMTRAKRKLIIIGDSATISTLPFYADFLRYVETVQGYRSAWEYLT
ncbi:MAG: AAA domain-containing protein, partial [Candidatus Omnitrophica bacterium]|nr:AAA domain-containing protein [Candidatus Omnitrophota bacterium]